MWDGDRGILHQEFQSSCCCQGQLWEINRSYLIHELSLFDGRFDRPNCCFLVLPLLVVDFDFTSV